jgi:transcriptional regulator with XRE-family HTH domain
MKNSLGTFVAELRKKRGLRQSDLGEKLGYSSQAISKFEKDDGSFPISSLPDLGNILGVTLDSFFLRDRRKWNQSSV